ncbi:MAG: hypothetical protein JOY71_16205 [Acetobacteraceae bacterium]|nr:hypothetical protein [Acetobacteraceae bacterium]MBV8523639.1 hypothetical protein [Acetobacteraceae bacterium]
MQLARYVMRDRNRTSEEKASRAAEEVASYENRVGQHRHRLAQLIITVQIGASL